MLKEILTQIGTTAVVIAIAAWLLKTWITHELENLHARSSHDLALKLENARAAWAKDVARLNVHESYLHKKRVKLIEQMHSEMVEAEFSLQNFLVAWWAHSNKEELVERGLLPPGHFDAAKMESMNKRGFEFCEKFTNINATLHRNALFFDDAFIESIREAYTPFFNTVLEFDYENIPPMPAKLKGLVTVGQAPRKAVIDKFRSALGVA